MYLSEMLNHTFPDIKGGWWFGARCPNSNTRLREDCSYYCTNDGWTRCLLGAPNTNEEEGGNGTHLFDGWMCGPEIQLLVENGWDVEEWEGSPTSRHATIPTHCDDARDEDEDEGRGDPSAFMVKILMNSLFGRFSIRSRLNRIDGQALSLSERG